MQPLDRGQVEPLISAPTPSLLMGVTHQSDIAELILDTLFQWGGAGGSNVFVYFQLTYHPTRVRNPIFFFFFSQGGEGCLTALY